MEHRLFNTLLHLKQNPKTYVMIIIKYFAQTNPNFGFQINYWIPVISLQIAYASLISHEKLHSRQKYFLPHVSLTDNKLRRHVHIIQRVTKKKHYPLNIDFNSANTNNKGNFKDKILWLLELHGGTKSYDFIEKN